MSIAADMRNNIAQLRGLVERGNGDLMALAPTLLERLEGDAERVEGLESVTCMDAEVLKELQALYPLREVQPAGSCVMPEALLELQINGGKHAEPGN